jgi:co-chaperonin GroES (HSP10)
MTFRALHDILIVKRESTESIIEVVGHKEHIGTVLCAGPGKHCENKETGFTWFVPMTVKPGDRIMFSHRAGMEVNIEGEKLLSMHEADIICILEPDAHVAMTDDWRQEACDVVATYNVHGQQAVKQ